MNKKKQFGLHEYVFEFLWNLWFSPMSHEDLLFKLRVKSFCTFKYMCLLEQSLFYSIDLDYSWGFCLTFHVICFG